MTTLYMSQGLSLFQLVIQLIHLYYIALLDCMARNHSATPFTGISIISYYWSIMFKTVTAKFNTKHYCKLQNQDNKTGVLGLETSTTPRYDKSVSVASIGHTLALTQHLWTGGTLGENTHNFIVGMLSQRSTG